MHCAENLTEHSKRLPLPAFGDHAHIQNDTFTYPRKWDKHGVVLEVRQYD